MDLEEDDVALNVVRHVYNGLNEENCRVASMFFDLSRAIELADYEIILWKLEFYGVRGWELLLF